MSSKAINTILNLKDNFSKGIKSATNSTSTFQRQIKKAENQAVKMRSGITNAFTGTFAKISALVGGFQLASFLKESEEGAKAQIDAETKLQAVLMNTPGMTKKAIDGIKSYASTLQNQGVIGDEVALSGAQQLGTYQLQAETIKKLMPGMEDLLAQTKGLNATQEDAVTVGNLMGKVMTGQTGALKKVGINFSAAQEQVLKYGTEEERASMLAEVLKQNVGGVNKAIRNTDQGKIQACVNAWGDFKEEVGKVVLQLKGQFAGWFADKIPVIQTQVLAFANGIKNAIQTVVSFFTKHKDTISSVFTKLKPVILGVISAIGSFMIITQVISAFNKIKSMIGGLSVISNPFALAAIAIGVLVAGLVYAYKHSEKFRKAVDPLLNNIKNFGSYLGQVIPPILKQFGDWFTVNILPALQKLGNFIINNILPTFMNLGNFFMTSILPILRQLAMAFINNLLPVLKQFGQFIAGTIIPLVINIGSNILTVLNTCILPLASKVLNFLMPAFSVAFNTICGVLKGWFEIGKGIVEGFIKVLDGIIEFITGVLTGDWKKAFNGLKTAFKGIIDGIKKIWQGVIDMLSSPVKAVINVFKKEDGGVAGKDSAGTSSGGKTKRNATGTHYFSGGWTTVGEHGRELLKLPSGSKILPNSQTESTLNKKGDVKVFVTVQGNIIGNEEYADYIGEHIVNKVQVAMDNM